MPQFEMNGGPVPAAIAYNGHHQQPGQPHPNCKRRVAHPQHPYAPSGPYADAVPNTMPLRRANEAGLRGSDHGFASASSSLATSLAAMRLEEQLSAVDIADLTPEEHQLLIDIRRRKLELLSEIEQLKDEIATITCEMTRLENQDEGKINTKQKQMSIGKKRFNMDPKKGIEFLVENGLLKHTPEDVAQFLMKGEGLNKTVIGDYLGKCTRRALFPSFALRLSVCSACSMECFSLVGERADFNMKVLDAFVEEHDFANLILVQALRQFLWSFRLPGEAQKIDRMMAKFAARYCQQNPGMFSNPDTCYVLSFAIIMLNTSLHNPSVKDKLTLDQFVTMNRGIDSGGDLPRELLASLYESIKQEPFKIPEDDGNDLMLTFFNPDREGWVSRARFD